MNAEVTEESQDESWSIGELIVTVALLVGCCWLVWYIPYLHGPSPGTASCLSQLGPECGRSIQMTVRKVDGTVSVMTREPYIVGRGMFHLPLWVEDGAVKILLDLDTEDTRPSPKLRGLLYMPGESKPLTVLLVDGETTAYHTNSGIVELMLGPP